MDDKNIEIQSKSKVVLIGVILPSLRRPVSAVMGFTTNLVRLVEFTKQIINLNLVNAEYSPYIFN